MRRFIRLVGIMMPLALGACASQQALDQTKSVADQALATANSAKSDAANALAAANRAQSTADQALKLAQQAETDAKAAKEEADRMFQRTLRK